MMNWTETRYIVANPDLTRFLGEEGGQGIEVDEIERAHRFLNPDNAKNARGEWCSEVCQEAGLTHIFPVRVEYAVNEGEGKP